MLRSLIGPFRYVGNAGWRSDEAGAGAASPNAAMRATQWKSSSGAPATASRQLFGSGLRTNPKPAEQPLSLCARRTAPETTKLYCTYYPKAGDSSLTMTCRNGNRMYIRVEKEKDLGSSPGEQRSSVPTRFASQSASSLLGVSIGDLLRRVQNARRKREHENLSSAIRMTANLAEAGAEGDSAGARRSSLVSPSPSRPNHEDCRMWVDKYAPSSFAHLLSDERTNREVVRALRAWDPYVFRRDPPPPPPKRPDFGGQNQPTGDRNRSYFQKAAPPNANPKDNRPDAASRVILLSGPPGIGTFGSIRLCCDINLYGCADPAFDDREDHPGTLSRSTRRVQPRRGQRVGRSLGPVFAGKDRGPRIEPH